jgi:hypothetical protein
MEGYFCCRWRIGLEDTIFLPFFLVLLLDSYEGISFFGLYRRFIRDVYRKGGRVLTPFNSFVWETATVSNAFTADSIFAMMLEIN